MNDVQVHTIEDVIRLLQTPQKLSLEDQSREKRYACIRDTLTRLRYTTLGRKEQGLAQQFLAILTGYSSRQIKRLVREWKSGQGLRYMKRQPVGRARRRYGPKDIALLIETDILHKTPNAHSVREILRREYVVFGREEYATISTISVSHIYNVRNHNVQYRSSDAIRYSKTNPVSVAIGERTKPRPYGKPGFIRVDSVHQGDRDKEKGVYHVNLVDEVTQWEIVVCVEGISEQFLLPALEGALESFPFVLLNFHSDNGSEYINQRVAGLLEGLRVHQTKSRSRRTNDNALAESKNGSVIRKHMGRSHIPKRYAPVVNAFYVSHFNDYLNYHRICAYATDYVDTHGKVRKKYETHRTPYETLKTLPHADTYLRPGTTFAELDKTAYAQSDNAYAKQLAEAKKRLAKQLQS